MHEVMAVDEKYQRLVLDPLAQRLRKSPNATVLSVAWGDKDSVADHLKTTHKLNVKTVNMAHFQPDQIKGGKGVYDAVHIRGLHHLDKQQQEKLLAIVAQALQPGGEAVVAYFPNKYSHCTALTANGAMDHLTGWYQDNKYKDAKDYQRQLDIIQRQKKPGKMISPPIFSCQGDNIKAHAVENGLSPKGEPFWWQHKRKQSQPSWQIEHGAIGTGAKVARFVKT